MGQPCQSPEESALYPQVLHSLIDGWVAKAVFNIWSETHFSSYERKLKEEYHSHDASENNNSRLVAEGDLEVERKRTASTRDGCERLRELLTEIRYGFENTGRVTWSKMKNKFTRHNKQDDSLNIPENDSVPYRKCKLNSIAHMKEKSRQSPDEDRFLAARKQTETHWANLISSGTAHVQSLVPAHLSLSASLIPSTPSWSWQSPQLWSIWVTQHQPMGDSAVFRINENQ